MPPEDWCAARENCRKFDSELVKIESKDENQFIKTEYFRTGDRYWIGLSDLNNDGKWKWTDGTGLTGYKNWGSGQPKNSNGQQCITIQKVNHDGWYDGEWNDYFCWGKFGYICEKMKVLLVA